MANVPWVDTNIVNTGMEYGFGASHVGAGWTYNKYDEDVLNDGRLFIVSRDVGIWPGGTLEGNVRHNTEGSCDLQ